MSKQRSRGTADPNRFTIGGYYLRQPYPDRGGYWYAFRHKPGSRNSRGRSLGTTDFEEAKLELATLLKAAPQVSTQGAAPGPDQVLTTAVLDVYLQERGPHIASEDAADRAVKLIVTYLASIKRTAASVSFWTPAQQLEFAKWCQREHDHSAAYIARLFDVMRSAFNDACVVRLRPDALGNLVESALVSMVPRIIWKQNAIAKELHIPTVRRKRAPTLSFDQMAGILKRLKTPHLFRFAIMSLCMWARPEAVTDFDPDRQIDWNDGVIDLAPPGWVQTKKRRPRQPLTQCLAGWLKAWDADDAERRRQAIRRRERPADKALLVYHGRRVASVKKAFRKIGKDSGLVGFTQKSFRHFMTDQVKKQFRGVPREHRSLWLGHVVRDGSPTTSHYESDDPHMLTDVALATDCILALIQERCGRKLFAVEPLLNGRELREIGARAIPKVSGNKRKSGGRGWDRTSDPYDVNVVRGTDFGGKSRKKARTA